MFFKKLLKYFILLYLVFFLVINWNEVSWFFNYKTASNFFSDIIPKVSVGEKKSEKEFPYSAKENSLEISNLGISAPLILVADKSQIQKGLDRGVVLFPEAALPGQPGQTIVLGHSAPPHWPRIKYNHIFNRISELKENDEIILYFEHKKYQYFVQTKLFLKKGEKLPEGDLTNFENMLILISCWPPETGAKRIAVIAKIVS